MLKINFTTYYESSDSSKKNRPDHMMLKINFTTYDSNDSCKKQINNL